MEPKAGELTGHRVRAAAFEAARTWNGCERAEQVDEAILSLAIRSVDVIRKRSILLR
jgi:hypothetical protein